MRLKLSLLLGLAVSAKQETYMAQGNIAFPEYLNSLPVLWE